MIRVYVPANDRLNIARRSGIVATEEPADGWVVIDYEGNLYGAANVVTFADRVDVAYGRQSMRYPTVARMTVRLSDLTEVGSFDPFTGLVTVTDEEALSAWLGGPLEPNELEAFGRHGRGSIV